MSPPASAGGLDGLTWTLYGFALTAVGPVLGVSSDAKGWITALSIVASAIGGAVGGTLADRFGRVRVLTWVILGYCLFTGLSAPRSSPNTRHRTGVRASCPPSIAATPSAGRSPPRCT